MSSEKTPYAMTIAGVMTPEDDRVLGHRLGVLAAAAGTNAVEPTRGSHIPGIGGAAVSRMPRPGDPARSEKLSGMRRLLLALVLVLAMPGLRRCRPGAGRGPRSSSTPGTRTRATTASTSTGPRAATPRRSTSPRRSSRCAAPTRAATRVSLRAQMRDIADAGVDEVVSSWWGRGSPEDRRLPAVMRAAKRRGLEVAVQLEPYAGRTIDSIAADLVYIRSLGIRDVYVYRTKDFTAEEWSRVTRQPMGLRLLRTDEPRAASRPAPGSPASTPTTSSSTTRRSSTASAGRRTRYGILCAPSVGPGYDALAATGDTRVKAAARRRDVRLDVECGASRAAPTSSRSRPTTSGAKGRRSSPPVTVAATRATTARTGCTGALRNAPTSRAPRTGRHASRKTSAPQPATSAVEDVLDTAQRRVGEVDLDVVPLLEPERAGALVGAEAEQRLGRDDVAAARSGAARSPRARAAPRAGRCGRSSPSRCRSRCRACSTRSTGRKPSPRFASVVGHAQIRAPARASRSSSAPSACVAWTTVVRSLRQPARSSSSIGRMPCSARHSSISRGCSSACTCSGSRSAAA